MSFENRFPRLLVAAVLTAACALTAAAAARAQQASPVRVAVIDVGRILEESKAGRAALDEIKALRDSSVARGQKISEEATSIQESIEQGRLSLAEDKLADLQSQLKQKLRELKNLEDDTNEELAKLRQKNLGDIEKKIMPVINEIGQEGAYTMIFNKFQSGLVFAVQEVDITDEVLRRFDLATGAESPAAPSEG